MVRAQYAAAVEIDMEVLVDWDTRGVCLTLTVSDHDVGSVVAEAAGRRGQHQRAVDLNARA